MSDTVVPPKTWTVETEYTAEDRAKTRTYLYTVCTMTDRLLRIVHGIAIKTQTESVIHHVEQCDNSLKQCLSMASDNNKHKISTTGQEHCTYYERQFVELAKEHILSRTDVKNAERLAYLLENLIQLVGDVVTYVPAAYHGTEWKDLQKHLRALAVCICPNADDLETDSPWTMCIYEALHLPIMLLPKGTEPYPVWKD